MTPNQENLHELAEEILQDRSNRSFRFKAYAAFERKGMGYGLWANAFREVCEILQIGPEQAGSRGRFHPEKIKRTSTSSVRRTGIENSLPRGDRD